MISFNFLTVKMFQTHKWLKFDEVKLYISWRHTLDVTVYQK